MLEKRISVTYCTTVELIIPSKLSAGDLSDIVWEEAEASVKDVAKSRDTNFIGVLKKRLINTGACTEISVGKPLVTEVISVFD